MSTLQKFDIALASLFTVWILFGYSIYIQSIRGNTEQNIQLCRTMVHVRMIKTGYIAPAIFYGALIMAFAFVGMKLCVLFGAWCLFGALVETLIIRCDMFGLRTRMLSKSQIS